MQLQGAGGSVVALQALQKRLIGGGAHQEHMAFLPLAKGFQPLQLYLPRLNLHAERLKLSDQAAAVAQQSALGAGQTVAGFAPLDAEPEGHQAC
jgi:hypothetical protein